MQKLNAINAVGWVMLLTLSLRQVHIMTFVAQSAAHQTWNTSELNRSWAAAGKQYGYGNNNFLQAVTLRGD